MNVLASMCDLLFSFRGIKSVNIYVHTCISFIVFFIFSLSTQFLRVGLSQE